MDKLNLMMSVCSFIGCLFFLVAKVNNAHWLLEVLVRMLGLVGTILPVIYWLKLLAII